MKGIFFIPLKRPSWPEKIPSRRAGKWSEKLGTSKKLSRQINDKAHSTSKIAMGEA